MIFLAAVKAVSRCHRQFFCRLSTVSHCWFYAPLSPEESGRARERIQGKNRKQHNLWCRNGELDDNNPSNQQPKRLTMAKLEPLKTIVGNRADHESGQRVN